MKRSALTFALLALLSPLAWAGTEELAGEADKVSRPQAKPTAEEQEDGSLAGVSRAARSAIKPNFELPEFVILGGGEQKAGARREGLAHWLDTSGSGRANPDEADANKNQLGAQTSKLNLQGVSETARPSRGELRAVYGWANTFAGHALFGIEGEKGWFTGFFEQSFSDGGDAGQLLPVINQSLARHLRLSAGTRLSSSLEARVDLNHGQRQHMITVSSLPAPRLTRDANGVELVLDGNWSRDGLWRARLGASKGQVLLPGWGVAYDEQLLDLGVDLQGEWRGKLSRAGWTSSVEYRSLAQEQLGFQRNLSFGLAKASLRLYPWRDGQISVGLRLDMVQGALSEFSVSPWAYFEQALGPGLSIWGDFSPGLGLATLNGDFEADAVLPNASLKLQKGRLKLESGLRLALAGPLWLEASGFVDQNDDAAMLEALPGSGLWTRVNQRQSFSSGVRAGIKARAKGDIELRALLQYQQASLPDSLGLQASFQPSLSGEASAGKTWGDLSLSLNGRYVGERYANLAGSLMAAAYFDLGAELTYSMSESLTLLAEGRNLAFQRVIDFPGYAEASPFAGLGLQFNF